MDYLNQGEGRARFGFWTMALLIFLFLLPKGGVKLGGVPVTWGFCLIGACAFFCLLRNCVCNVAVSQRRVVAYLPTLGFPIFGAVAIAANGHYQVGFVIAFFVAFAFLPLALIVIFGPDFDRMDVEKLLGFVRMGVICLSIFGIIDVLWYGLTRHNISIPTLTGALWDISIIHKDNDRGPLEKLVSTYNNGNLFGVSMSLLMPMVYGRSSFWGKLAPRLAMFLTLSRTVWIGLLLIEAYRLIVGRKTLLSPVALIIGVVAVLLAAGAGEAIAGHGMAFLFDPTLGGRAPLVHDLSQATFWPTVRYAGIAEIVYASVAENLGWLGLFIFLITMLAPLMFVAATASFRDPTQRDLFAGLLIYLVLAGADGGILYIPVMVFYWTIVSILLRGAYDRKTIEVRMQPMMLPKKTAATTTLPENRAARG